MLGKNRRRGAGLVPCSFTHCNILMTIIRGLCRKYIDIANNEEHYCTDLCKVQGNFLACFKQIKIKQTLGVVTTS